MCNAYGSNALIVFYCFINATNNVQQQKRKTSSAHSVFFCVCLFVYHLNIILNKCAFGEFGVHVIQFNGTRTIAHEFVINYL